MNLVLDPVRTTIALVSAAVLVLVGVALMGTPLDTQWLLVSNAWAPVLPSTGSMLSLLGLGTAAVLLAALVGLREPRVLAALLLMLLIGGVLVHAIKAGVAAPRPAAVLGVESVTVIGALYQTRAMPSGHAAVLGGMFAFACLAPWRRVDRWLAAHLAGVLAVLAVAVAAARVLVGAHWPSDVLVGFGIGIAVATLVGGTRPGYRAVEAVAIGMTRPIGCGLIAAICCIGATVLATARSDYPLADPLRALLVMVGAAAAAGWLWRTRAGVELPQDGVRAHPPSAVRPVMRAESAVGPKTAGPVAARSGAPVGSVPTSSEARVPAAARSAVP